MMDQAGADGPEFSAAQMGSAAVTQRDRAKHERRARLIKAARALMTENAGGNFSMGELAARAGLSLATPYNLFGSKTAILQAVFRAEMEGFHKRYKILAHLQPVEQVLATIGNVVNVFTREPAFYRSLTRSLMTIPSDDFSTSILPLSDNMFLPLVEGLIEAGAIRLALPAGVISMQLLRVFNSVFLLWALQNWSEDQLLQELKTGFSLSFIGLFEGENRAQMLAQLAPGGRGRDLT
jgi:AcrR family transcriptional regulator